MNLIDKAFDMSYPAKVQIPVERTARYYVSGDINMDYKHVLFVLHGYGMNASKFIEKFSDIYGNDTLVIAPEGLSRYYKNGFSGEVVASWMTSDDREAEITDYLNFLNTIVGNLKINAGTRLHALGFSQGASTASRWVMQSENRFSSLILWSGEFAPDIPQKKNGPDRIFNIVGTRDRFIDEKRFEAQTKSIENKGFKVDSRTFNGDHTIHSETLVSLWEEAKKDF